MCLHRIILSISPSEQQIFSLGALTTDEIIGKLRLARLLTRHGESNRLLLCSHLKDALMEPLR